VQCRCTIFKPVSRQNQGASLNRLSVSSGVKEYSTAIDMWSVGCIMGELILNAPLLSGKSEMEQIHKIFNLVGSPTAQNWPKHQDLPNLKRVRHQSI